MGRCLFCREAVVCFWVSLFLAANVCYGNDGRIEVTGIGECVDGQENKIETGHAYKGLRVIVGCKSKDGDHFKTIGSGELDEEGKFRVFLPSEVAERGKLKEECFAKLVSAGVTPCPSTNGLESSSMLVFMAETDEKHCFGLKDKLKFSPFTCSSAFLWPFFNPLHPAFPFFRRPLPPPFHIYRKPFPPLHPVFKKPLPPPIPVLKNHLPPPIPVLKKPLPPPIPVFKKPPPVPVSKKPLPPPIPVYKERLPPPVPVFQNPLTPPVPVFQNPIPPPVPIYKPIPRIHNPPLKEPFPPHIPILKKHVPPPFATPTILPPPLPAFKKPTLPPIPIYKQKHPYFRPLPPWPKINPFNKKPSSPIPSVASSYP